MSEDSGPKFPNLCSLPQALGKPTATARIRSIPEDFQVDELLPFQPEGAGEHLFVQVRKRNTNTDWLARELARAVNIPVRDVSYAGLKDRNAVTSQWFSLRIPGKQEPDLAVLESDDIQIVQMLRHQRKLRRGALAANSFVLTLREVNGDQQELEQRLQQINESGVPNYFGEQRFGHEGKNLLMAQRLFRGELKKLSRNKRSIYISAARSFLFNQVLARRVSDKSWNLALAGDLMILDGSNSRFPLEKQDAEIERRLLAMDIHPSGPMWGRGESQAKAEVDEIESGVLADHKEWCRGLEGLGLGMERRPLRMRVLDLQWEWNGSNTLQLRFSLYPGSYATSLLRELVVFS